MKAEKGKKKLGELVEKEQSPLLEEIKWRQENEDWLDVSARIAMAILKELKKRNMSQQELAFMMKVQPQYISRLVKGNENLTLESLCKLEKILGIKILNDLCAQSDQMIISTKNYQTMIKMAGRSTAVSGVRLKKVFKATQQLGGGTSLKIGKNEEILYEEEAAE